MVSIHLQLIIVGVKMKRLFLFVIFVICITCNVNANQDKTVLLILDGYLKSDLAGVDFGNSEKTMIITERLYKSLLPFHAIQMDKIIAVNDNISYDEIKDIIKGLVKGEGKVKFLAIDDKAVFINAKLRDEFKLHGFKEKDIRKFRYKNISKDILIRSGIRVPKYMLLDYKKYKKDKEVYIKSIEQFIGYPMFVKPIDEAGSNGARKIESRDDLSKWLENVNTNVRYEIDEFIEGQLVAVDSLIFNNKVLHMEAVENLNPYYTFTNGKAMGSLVIPKNSKKFKRLP